MGGRRLDSCDLGYGYLADYGELSGIVNYGEFLN
jgi:hypothetical protein